MDLFQIPDDYKPEKPLTDQQMEDITKYLQNHPLFMKTLPQNIQQNQHLIALKALSQDDDPNTTAESYNTQANQILKKGPDNKMYLRHAYQKYTDAINVKCSNPKINAKIHSNRAQINLKLKNYGKVIIDCKISLKFDSQYTKSYYRYAKALMAVKKYEEIQKLLKDRKQPQLIELKEQAHKQLENLKQAQNKKNNTTNQKQKKIEQYCKQKNYKLLPRAEDLPQGTQIDFNGKQISIPILFAYPHFGQIDIIAKTQQNVPIKQYLKQLFQNPLPWDTKNQYTMNNCQIFYDCSQDTIMKIPKQAKICQIASRISMKGAIQLNVLCKSSSYYSVYVKNKKII